MRVSVEHRSSTTGGSRVNYFVDCTILLSEEERAIVEERGLNHFSFRTNTSDPEPTLFDIIVTDALNRVGPLSIFTGIVLFVFSVIAPTWFVAWLFLIVGAVFWAWGMFKLRGIANWKLERTVTVAHLISDPRLTMWAKDPPWAKALEDQLRDDLTQLKARIMDSAKLGENKSFEL
jgi:hypothetical protein